MPGLVEQWLQRTNSAHLRSCVNALPEGSGLVRCAFVPSPPIEEQWARSVWTRPHYLRGRNAISGFLILLGSQVRRKLSQHAKVKFRPHSSSELILPSLVCLDRLDLWEWENTGKVICLKVQFVSHEMNPLYGVYFSENPLGERVTYHLSSDQTGKCQSPTFQLWRACAAKGNGYKQWPKEARWDSDIYV